MIIVGAMTVVGASIALAILSADVVFTNCKLIKIPTTTTTTITITTTTTTTTTTIIVLIATNIIVMMLSRRTVY